jgi:hypothetical protein
MQKIHAETSREIFYDSNFILISKNIQKRHVGKTKDNLFVHFYLFFKKYFKKTPEGERQITLKLYLIDYYCLRFS